MCSYCSSQTEIPVYVSCAILIPGAFILSCAAVTFLYGVRETTSCFSVYISCSFNSLRSLSVVKSFIMDIFPRKDHGKVYAEPGNPFNYIVIIDAGSTGSRAYVYHYPSKPLRDDKSNVNFPQVSMSGNKWMKKIRPGLSSFADNSEKAGSDHIKDLIQFAEKIVPESQHYRTPVFLHATGGLRLLTKKQQHALLTGVCQYVQKKTQFYVPECDTHFSTIEGSSEGIFGWVAMNYLIGDFSDPDAHAHGKGHTTYGFLDMGGASAQITFVPNATGIESHKQQLYMVKLATIDGERDMSFNVYSKSFLGAGVYEARRKYLEALKEEDDGKLHDPCLLKGQSQNWGGGDLRGRDDDDDEDNDDDEKEEDDKEHSSKPSTTTKSTPSTSLPTSTPGAKIVGSGDAQKCLSLIEPQLTSMFKDESIPAFDFEINHFVGVSEYYDTNQAFQLGSAYDRAALAADVKEFCGSSWDAITKSNEYADIKRSDLKTLCFKSNWLLGMIHTGFGFPEDFSHNSSEPLTGFLAPLQTAQEINGVEYSWTLGRAVLYASSELGKNGKTMGIQAPFSNTWNYGAESGRRVRPKFDASKVKDDEVDDDDRDWGDVLDSKSHRLWGSILFLLILVIAVYLLLGRTRRRFIWDSIKARVDNLGIRRADYLRVAQRRQESDRLAASQEYELNEVDDDFEVQSDEENVV